MRKILTYFLFSLSFTACDDIFEVGDISDNTVELLAPSDNSILNILTPTFSWTPLEEAENYHLQIATPNFSEATQIVLDTLVTESNYAVSLDTIAYQWRVRAENSGYQTDYTTQSFSIEE